MKGKKINTDFVSDFIVKCVNQEKSSPQNVCQEAQLQISQVNQQLKQIVQLKKHKANLLDVLIAFDQYKSSKNIDRSLLPFFTISDKTIAHDLWQQISIQPLKNILLKEVIVRVAHEMEKLQIILNQDGWLRPSINFESFNLFLRKHYGRL